MRELEALVDEDTQLRLMPTELYPTNDEVDYINQRELDSLPQTEPLYQYAGEDTVEADLEVVDRIAKKQGQDPASVKEWVEEELWDQSQWDDWLVPGSVQALNTLIDVDQSVAVALAVCRQ